MKNTAEKLNCRKTWDQILKHSLKDNKRNLNYKINFDACADKSLDEKIDILTESSPISDHEMWATFTQRIKHKQNLTYGELEARLKDIFKIMQPDIFIDRKETFERIKKRLLKKHYLNGGTCRQMKNI